MSSTGQFIKSRLFDPTVDKLVSTALAVLIATWLARNVMVTGLLRTAMVRTWQ